MNDYRYSMIAARVNYTLTAFSQVAVYAEIIRSIELAHPSLPGEIRSQFDGDATLLNATACALRNDTTGEYEIPVAAIQAGGRISTAMSTAMSNPQVRAALAPAGVDLQLTLAVAEMFGHMLRLTGHHPLSSQAVQA